MGKIRVAVIGTGHLGSFHAKVYSAIEKKSGIELVGVCDTDESVAKEVAKKYNTDYFTNYHDLLDKVDAVSIVVPTSLHYMVAKDFLEAGVHVLIEKPLTKTLQEADELIELAKAGSQALRPFLEGGLPWIYLTPRN